MRKGAFIFVLAVVVGLVLFFLWTRRMRVMRPGELIPVEATASMSIPDISEAVKKSDRLIEAMGIPKGKEGIFSDIMKGMKLTEDIDSPEDLSGYGLEPEGGLCLVWHDLKFKRRSLIAQIKDKDLTVKTIKEKLAGSAEKSYSRIRYWAGEKATCGVVSSCLVISKEEEDFLTIARLATGEGKALRPKVAAGSELAFHLNLVRISPEIKSKVEMAMPFIKMASQRAGQSKGEPVSLITAMLELEVSGALALLGQLNSFGLALDLDNEEAKITTSIQCKEDSALRKYLVSQPGSFTLLGYLPEDAPMVMGFRYDAELGRSAINECVASVLDFMDSRTEMAEGEKIKGLIEAWKEYASYQGSEYVFSWLANPGTFLDLLYIMEVTDGDAALAAYTDLELYNRAALPWLTLSGTTAPSNLYQAGPSEMHQGIEIRQIVLKGYRDAVANMMDSASEERLSLYPQDIHMWFACKDNILVYSISEESASAKAALDRIIEGEPATEAAYKDRSILLRISLLGMAKNFVGVFSKMSAPSPLTGINWEDVKPQSRVTVSGVFYEGELQYELTIPAQTVREIINLGRGRVGEK